MNKRLFSLLLLLGLAACEPNDLKQAQTHLEQAEYTQAEAVLNQLVNQEAAPAEARILLAQASFYTQGPDVALAQLQDLYATEQDNPAYQAVLMTLSQEFARLDQLVSNPEPQAIQDYLQTAPHAFFSSRAQWLLYLNAGRTQTELKAELAQSPDPLILQLAQWETARTEPLRFQQLLETFPDSPFRFAWYEALTQHLWENEQESMAHSLLVRWKNELSDQDPQKAHVLLKQADYSSETHPTAALNYYQTYLRLFPEHPAGRATIYKIRENFKDRLTGSEHRALAEAAMARYMYQTAYSALSQVPAQSAQAHYQLAEYAMKAKYYPQASQHFNTLLQHFKGTREAGLASVGLAAIQRQAKAYGAAMQQLQTIKVAYQSQPEVVAAALWEEGILYDYQNQDARRAIVYQQLADIAPDYEHAMSALWHAVWFDFREARYAQVLEKLTRFAPHYQKSELKSRFVYWQGRAHEELEQWDLAKQHYQQLIEGSLMDYYTHRAKERLRLLQHGGGDHYATQTYQGYQTERAAFPTYQQAFLQAVKGDTLALSPVLQLLYLGQIPEFMQFANLSAEPRLQVLYGLQLQREGRYYEAVTRYRYLAAKDDVYLPAAFPLAYFETIQAEAKKYQMNPFLAAGLIWQESQYKPDIKSWVGATGLMQIMPATGQGIAKALELQNYDLTHAETNIQMGVWYLHTRHQEFDNNSLLAVASYNAGAGPVYRWLKESGHLPYDALAESITYPETRGYVKHVFTSYWVYQALYGRE